MCTEKNRYKPWKYFAWNKIKDLLSFPLLLHSSFSYTSMICSAAGAVHVQYPKWTHETAHGFCCSPSATGGAQAHWPLAGTVQMHENGAGLRKFGPDVYTADFSLAVQRNLDTGLFNAVQHLTQANRGLGKTCRDWSSPWLLFVRISALAAEVTGPSVLQLFFFLFFGEFLLIRRIFYYYSLCPL